MSRKIQSQYKRNFFKKGLGGAFFLCLGLLTAAGCSGVVLDLGSNPSGSYLDTANDPPVVQEVTWTDLSADELVAGWQQYLGAEVYVRNTVVSAKSETYIMVGGGRIKVELTDASFIDYLAVTDTVEARGFVSGLDEQGNVVIENAHVNVWFSCYPREHTATDIGNGDTVQTNDNGVPGDGWPGS